MARPLNTLLRRLAPPLLLLALGLTAAFYPTLFSGFHRMQNDPGDTRHLNYILEHDYLWLTRARLDRDLWSPPIFYPVPNAAAYTELLLGALPFYAPWRLMRFAPDTSFQLWMFTVSILNFGAMYWLIRRCFALSTLASSLGAFLFAFGSPRLNQLNHQFLLPQFFTVLALFSIALLFRAHASGACARRCPLFLLGLSGAVAAQIYTSYYQGWFLVFALAVALGCAMLARTLRRELFAIIRAHLGAIAVSVLLCAAALAPLAAHYLAAAKAVGFRRFWEAEGMLPRFQSWFYLGGENWLYGWMASHDPFIYLPQEWEQRLGLGVVTTAVVLWTLFQHRNRPAIRVTLMTWLVIVLTATMYRGQISPWKWVFHWVPGASAIRAVCRIGMLATIPAAFGLALFIDRARPSTRRWQGLAVGLFCLLEQGRRCLWYDKRPIRQQVAALAAEISPGCPAFYFACATLDRPALECQLDAMWAALEAGTATVNGYSSNNPPQFGDLTENVIRGPADDERLRQALQHWEQAYRLDAGSVCRVGLARD